MAKAKSQTSSTDTSTEAPVERDELAELKAELAQLKAESASKDNVIREANAGRQTAEQRVMSEQERRLRSELASTETTLVAMENEAVSLSNQIGTLSDEPGHGKEIAELTRKLARVEARIETEGNRKAFYTNQITQAAEASKQVAAVPKGEVLANGNGISNLSPAVQQWFRAHPKSFSDPAYLKRVFAAANYATDVEGIEAETPEYFEFVEAKMGERKAPVQARDDDEGEDLGTATADSPYSKTAPTKELDYRVEAPQTRAAGAGTLPPSRSVPTSSGTKQGRTPMLNPDEREVADALFAQHANPADRYEMYANYREKTKHRLGRGITMN